MSIDRAGRDRVAMAPSTWPMLVGRCATLKPSRADKVRQRTTLFGRPSVLLIIRPVLRHGSAWDRRRPSGRAAKQLREEARPASVAASGPAAPRIVR